MWDNGRVPKTPPQSRQAYAGLTLNTAINTTVYDNRVTAPYSDDFAFVVDSESTFLDERSWADEGAVLNYACIGLVDGDFPSNIERPLNSCYT